MMPKVGEKAQEAWAEFRESCEMVLEIEKEALKLVDLEAEVDCKLIKKKLHQVGGLLKKREDALKRHLHHLKRGE